MKTAVERLMDLLPEQDGCAALITSGKNRRYLTGFPSSAGMVLVTKQGAWFMTDFRYFEAAQLKIKDCNVLMYTRAAETLQQLFREQNITTVYLEYSALTLAEADDLENTCKSAGVQAVKDGTLDTILRTLRIVKTPQEIQKIRDAQAITDASFEYILGKIHPGVTEREIALDLEFFMRRNGAEGVAFELIVVSGANGSQCHGVPSEKKIESGDFVTMDIGALLDGYHSDMTRTVAVGEVTEDQRRVYQTVLDAQLAALAVAKPGAVCSSVDKAARDIIEKDYPGTFGHSTGHGVGVEIHEWPRFAASDSTTLLPGMVVTVEPGIYLAGRFGVRIEDMIAVTESGTENLTHSPKELIIL